MKAVRASPKFDPATFLANLTRKPGVYRMLDECGAALYVGKARSLRPRVTSYFRASGLANKTMALVARISDIEITVTSSETEALLLEQSLIKQERPPYNVVLRDDKSYPYIYLTDHGDFPRLTFHRGARRKTGRYFGPFPSASAVRDSLNALQKLFRIRQCDDTFFKNRSRPCLQYQIRRCSAPCVGLVTPESYRQDVELGVMFLEGRSDRVLESLKRRMAAAAERLEFEYAAKFEIRYHNCVGCRNSNTFMPPEATWMSSRWPMTAPWHASRRCTFVPDACSGNAPGFRVTNCGSAAPKC